MAGEASPASVVFDEWEGWISYSPASQAICGQERAMVAETATTYTDRATVPCSQPIPPSRPKLGFLEPSAWDQEKDYNDGPPACIRSTIEWKICVNNRAASRDTEQDVVLAPSTYWRLVLKSKVEALVAAKFAGVRPIDISVKISINDRGEREVTKRFDNTSILWSQIVKQLLTWAELFRAGKRLMLAISFDYENVVSAVDQTRGKGARLSATKRMLTERDEQESSGQPSSWRYVYKLMRCSGAPCHLGPHCWVDPDDKKHYKLRTHHMRLLIRHVESGGTLELHEDVPPSFRE